MKIRVIIPVLNPKYSFFSDIIPMLETQTLFASILLINSGAPIPTGNYEVIQIDKKEFNHANTRNLSLSYNDDFYLFMTQDATPMDTLLIENLVNSFEDSDVVVSYARQIPYFDTDPIERFARETNYPAKSCTKSQKDLPELGIKTFFSSDSCAMYRGDYFRAVGGFTADLNTNEDMEFSARSIITGKKVAYVAEAKVYHSHLLSMKQLWNRYYEIGVFFTSHKWILNEVSKHSKLEYTGIKHALDEIKYLFKTAPFYVPKSILFSVIKFISFKSALKGH